MDSAAAKTELLSLFEAVVNDLPGGRAIKNRTQYGLSVGVLASLNALELINDDEHEVLARQASRLLDE